MAATAFFLFSSLAVIALFAFAGAAAAPRTVRGGTMHARIAIGFALFPLVCVLPLYVTHSFIPSALALAGLAAIGARRLRFSLPKAAAEKTFWLAALANLALLSYGTGMHPGLGDHDPYEHAMAVSYLYETGSLFPTPEAWSQLATLDPYPPGYDAAAAALSRLFGSVASGLRVWAIVCAALFPIAVRFFARGMGLGESSSAVAGAVAVLLPPAPTHFAWTHTLGISLTLVAAGALALSLRGRKWVLPAAGAGAALALSATSDTAYSLVLLVPIAWQSIRQRAVARVAAAAAVAACLVAPWGIHVARHTLDSGKLFEAKNFSALRTRFDAPREALPWYKKHRGNARPYEAREFFLPYWRNYFNVPVGLPAAAFIPACFGLALWWRRKGIWWPAAAMAAMLVAVQGERLPAEFFPHRAWTYLAALTAFGFAVCWRSAAGWPGKGRIAAATVMAIGALSFGHAAAVRVRMESLQWTNEVFTGEFQRDGYYRLLTTVDNQKTYPLAGGMRFGHVPALGGRVTFWEEKELAAGRAIGERKYAEALGLLEQAGYRYLALDSTLDLWAGDGASDGLYRAITARGGWRQLSAGEGFALFVRDSR